MSFGDTTLPKIELAYVRPVAGAVNDWAADILPVGLLASWPDLVSGLVLPSRSAAGNMPSVVTDGGRRIVRFDGVANWMQLAYAKPQPMTTVIVARMNELKAGNTVLAGGVHVRTDGTNTKMEVTAGTALGTSAAAVNTNWRIYIVVNNGANSSISVDGVEVAGNAGTSSRTFINLGINSAASVFNRTDYTRLAFLPYAATTAERASILAQMKAQYGL
ncbi:hypothetical protein [Arthrobacter sp. Leaf234]|uniref:hypothetical protein n=1 Tax=Arthrobacter sp. Leaf234 TaxID=1736303 RepID=UPI0012F8DB92|nr:hypothetical protein [Arthrobacter sp. Leaf234]